MKVCSQVPQYLHEAGWAGNGFMIGVTQPRRVAVTTVSPSDYWYIYNVRLYYV